MATDMELDVLIEATVRSLVAIPYYDKNLKENASMIEDEGALLQFRKDLYFGDEDSIDFEKGMDFVLAIRKKYES